MNVQLDALALRQSLPGRSRPGWRRGTFLLVVALPTLLLLLYLHFIAAPQYVAQFRYSVFSEAGGVSNGGNGLALTSGTPSRTFDWVVADYAVSNQAVADLTGRLRLAGMFKPPGHDVLFRFWWDDGSVERLGRYWRNWIVDARFDSYESIGTVEVRAFTPQDAQKLAATLLELTETVVNNVGQKERDAAVAAAEGLFARADARMQDVRRRIEAFRNAQRSYVPSRPANSSEALAAGLRDKLATMGAQYAALSKVLSPTAPGVVNLRSQLAATEHELDRVLNTLGGIDTDTGPSGGARLPHMLADYDYLDHERQFATTLRDDSLKLLEQVRYNAQVQHLYLHAHVRPQTAAHAAVSAHAAVDGADLPGAFGQLDDRHAGVLCAARPHAVADMSATDEPVDRANGTPAPAAPRAGRARGRAERTVQVSLRLPASLGRAIAPARAGRRRGRGGDGHAAGNRAPDDRRRAQDQALTGARGYR